MCLFLLFFLFSVVSVASSHQLQHFLLNLHFSKSSQQQLRLRFNEESFRISRPIHIYLDFYPLEWRGFLEGSQGETQEIILKPGRTKTSINLNFMKEELSLQYFLTCEPNFYGPWCTKRCIPDEDGAHFTCNSNGERDCRPGWTGEFCSEVLLMCSPTPCRNKAVCLEKGNGQFACLCSPGYEGTLCERVSQLITPSLPTTPTSTPFTLSSVTTTTRRPATTQSLPVKKGLEPSNFSYFLQIVYILLCVIIFLFLVFVSFYFCRWKRDIADELSIPSLPKCEVAFVPQQSPTRYVISPKKLSYISFDTAPELPRSAKPRLYLSAEDLHV